MKLQKGDLLVCDICSNKVECLVDGEGPIVCCGQDMDKE